jgi:hypothetical protein
MKTKIAVWMSLAIVGWSLALAGVGYSQTKPATESNAKLKDYVVTMSWANTPGTSVPEDVVTLNIAATEGEMSRSRETSINGEDKTLVHEFSVQPTPQKDGTVKLTIDGAFRIVEANYYRLHEFSVSPSLKLNEPRQIRSINKRAGNPARDVKITVTIDEVK